MLFYATDDDAAATTTERLIHAAGFEPLKAGGVSDAGRIEMPGGDLHQAGLNGALLDRDEARTAVAAERAATTITTRISVTFDASASSASGSSPRFSKRMSAHQMKSRHSRPPPAGGGD